jgi:hypothetical protein
MEDTDKTNAGRYYAGQSENAQQRHHFPEYIGQIFVPGFGSNLHQVLTGISSFTRHARRYHTAVLVFRVVVKYSPGRKAEGQAEKPF